MSETTGKTTAKQEQTVRKKADLMYLGPNIVGVVRHSTVFKNGNLPEKVNKYIKEFPIMEKLFVPIADMPKAVIELNKSQSVLRTVYTQVAEKFV